MARRGRRPWAAGKGNLSVSKQLCLSNFRGAKYDTAAMHRRQWIPARLIPAVLAVTGLALLAQAQSPERAEPPAPTLLGQVIGETVSLAAFGPPGSILVRWKDDEATGAVLAHYPFAEPIADRPGQGRFNYAVMPSGELRRPAELAFPNAVSLDISSGPVARFIGGTALRGMFIIERKGHPPVEVVVPVGQVVGGVAVVPSNSGPQVIELDAGVSLERVVVEPGPGAPRQVLLSQSGRDAANPEDAVLGIDGKPLAVSISSEAGGGIRMVAELAGGRRIAEGETLRVDVLERVLGPAQD